MNQFPTYRSSRNFTDPDEFIPERFLNSPGINYTNDDMSAFQPFNTGRHSCIGQKLAYAEMRLVLAKMIYSFDMHLADGNDVWDWGVQKTFIFWEKRPLYVILKEVEHK